MGHSYNESDKNHGGTFMKKMARNVLAFALALTMAVPLAACKKTGDDKKGGGNARNGKKQTVIAEDDPFFDAVEIPLDVETDKDKKVIYKEISDPVIIGDRIFSTYNISYEMPKDVMDSIADIDCTNEKEYAKVQEIYNSYYEMGTLVYDIDGNLISRTPSADMESASGKLAKLADGTYVMVASKITPNECKTSSEIVKLNDKFEEQGSIKLDESIELGFGPDIIPLDNGNIMLCDYSAITVVDQNGKKIASESANGYCGKVYQADGKTYMLIDEFDSAKNEDKFYFQEIDPNTAKPVGDRIATTYEAYNLMQGPDGLYSIGYSGLKKFDIASGSAGDVILDWNWTDVNSGYVSTSNATILSDDEMVFTKYSWKEEEDPKTKVSGRDVSLVKLTRAEKNPHAGKSVIELGCIGAEAAFRDYVIAYNKDPNHISRILISDYADQVFEKTDYTQALADLSDQVYLDLLSGDGPDILMNFYGYSQFNNEEILEDLNKYIDGQGGMNRDEYFDNIFRACEESGKLFQIPVCVNVSGFAGNPGLIGDRTSWTYEEFEQVASSLPSDVSLIRDTARTDLLSMILDSSLSSFVDNVNKEVSFDSADFIKLLNIVKKYGSDKSADDISADKEGMMEYVDDSDKFREGLLALMNVEINGVEDYARLFDGLSFKPTLIGMPGSENAGMAGSAQLSFAIAASSTHKDEAWDFIRFLFDEECQGEFAKSFWGIPVHRQALEKKNEEDVKEYNQYVEDYANFLKEEGLSESEHMNMTKITPEICDGFIKMLEGVSVMKSTDTGIMSIVKEETAAFFANQKPAEDVCKVIQNRATTKVHER